jgi:photosystem II stability/assembly factor-like uncharacterized protein
MGNKYNFRKQFLLILFLFLIALESPKSQPAQWENIGPGGGGAFYVPQISPFNPNEMFFSSDMSGLYHTTDLGNYCSIVNFQYVTAGGVTRVSFTNDQNILYTINQHEFGNFPVKSTDKGASWSKLKSDPTDGGAWQIFASDEDFNKVIVTDYTNVYFSSDGGNNFKSIFSGNSGTWGSYIAGVLWSGNNIYICQPDGFLFSNNGGSSFSNVKPGGLGSGEFIISAAGAKSGNTVRFFAVTNASCYPGMTGAEHNDYKSVYSIDYGGASWIKKINGLPGTAHPFFCDMAKSNMNIAYVAGAEINGNGPGVYKTTDGGNSWSSVFILQNNQNIKTGWSGFGGDRNWSYGEYTLGFAVCRTNPDYMIITDLGFPHISTNGGAMWEQMYVNKADENPANQSITRGKAYRSIGVENTSCWNLCWSDSNNVFGSYTDIMGARTSDAGNSWSFDYTGHNDNTMYYCIKHPISGTLYAATSSVHDMYQSTYLTDNRIDGGRGKVLSSTDKGKTWTTNHDFVHPVIWLASDPNNPAKMYASVVHSSAGGIYKCDNINAGASSVWTKLASPPRTQGHPYNIHVLKDGSLVCTYSGRMTNDRKSFLASSGVFYSTNDGTTWIDRSDANMQYWTKDIVIDPNDASQNTWYVGVFSGWGGGANNKGGLYMTTNRGQLWTKILSKERVESCTINPANKDEMYVSTEYEGLYVCKNLSSGTPAFNLVQSYPFKHPMRMFFNPYDNNELYISSFGYGIVRGQMVTVNPPEKVILSLPANNAIEIDTNVTLLWQSLGAKVGYILQISEYADFSVNAWDLKGIVANSKSFSLKPLTYYYWRVQGENIGGAGPWSDVWQFRTKQGNNAPGIVTLISPLDDSKAMYESIVHFIWKSVPNATKYNFQISTVNDFNALDKDTVINDTTIDMFIKYKGGTQTTYFWRVRAGNSVWGNFSKTSYFLIEVPQGVEEDDGEFTLSPNPASDYIENYLDNHTLKGVVGEVRIYDVLGVEVINSTLTPALSLKGEGVRINVSHLSPGVYFVRIGDVVRKFVKY